MKLQILLLIFCCGLVNAQVKPPNIVFCLADDWGYPHAGAYGDQGVKTPNFDRLAKEGVLFNHAFVSSPSCTPSRNAFITGKYHWELGSGANLWSTLPEEHESFIHLLADNGYTTGRTNAKTWGPGNLDSWIASHGSHPSNKGYNTFEDFLETTTDDEPFFFWLGTLDPHRAYEKGTGEESGIDISKVHLYKHYPESDVIRKDVADYYYEVQRWDSLVGSVIKQLEENNLLENTIIIMTGDHGMPFPRGKGNLYDSGVRVPFAVRWGNEIKAGRAVDDYVSFADIAPTLLEAAGVKTPQDMTGKSLVNILKSESPRSIDRSDIVFGRERHVPAQEKPNMGGYPSRGYRNDNFLYIRNYKPDLWPAGTGNSEKTNYPNQWYADCDGGPTKDYIVANKDLDQEHQLAYELCFGKRPAEELYDIKNDPDQVNNIANDKAYAKTLESLRAKLQAKLTALNDPRATNPDYEGFDQYPYLGGGGGKKN
ncbi:sulfatase family protein [Arcticibacterium luteifluviistationis]|uniref:Heparan N-sulfatase n=1 Tax=Arcticibacterium luteifluviistationis TaxID=1784714 RepID=A0A2Z4GG96_9BACT|nr:sulfatase [Arcticibacterium luteifluviistationis]AWW00281.1 heparan N-sulfatase [Arcticibacterium luteifluviistationis]